MFVQFIIAAIKEAEECPTSSENRFGEVLLGFWSLELERRGLTVVSIDLISYAVLEGHKV